MAAADRSTVISGVPPSSTMAMWVLTKIGGPPSSVNSRWTRGRSAATSSSESAVGGRGSSFWYQRAWESLTQKVSSALMSYASLGSASRLWIKALSQVLPDLGKEA